MPDKYDEVATDFAFKFGMPNGIQKLQIAAFLRSAFPPPAEDARMCAKKALQVYGLTAYGHFDEDDYQEAALQKAAAEVESFAEPRVAPWREALVPMIEYAEFVYGSVLMKDVQFANKSFNEIRNDIDRAHALLSDSPAKEAAK